MYWYRQDPQLYKCDKCAGNGAYISKIDGKTYKCSKCDGTGKIQVTCDHCKGTGVLEYPKSTLPPVDQSITWNGWKVTVSTIPKGASIKLWIRKQVFILLHLIILRL